jgi:hypothetical protein
MDSGTAFTLQELQMAEFMYRLLRGPSVTTIVCYSLLFPSMLRFPIWTEIVDCNKVWLTSPTINHCHCLQRYRRFKVREIINEDSQPSHRVILQTHDIRLKASYDSCRSFPIHSHKHASTGRQDPLPSTPESTHIYQHPRTDL